LKVQWTEDAKDDLRRIITRIKQDNREAAHSMAERIRESIRPAAHFPEGYKEGPIPGTREIVAHPNYKVVYVIESEYIEVIAVVHTRLQWPPIVE
jgi:toxin ParE1/3/4